MRIILMRHGQSTADIDGVYEGRLDCPLTDLGRSQALSTAQGLLSDGKAIDIILASPLRRARETAEILGRVYSVAVVSEDLLMELDNGPCKGLPHKEGMARYPPPPFKSRFEQFIPHNGGESEYQLYIRCIRFVELLTARTEEHIAVVSHGAYLSMLLRFIVGAQPPYNWKHGIFFHFGDTGYCVLDYKKDREAWGLVEFRPSPGE